MLIYPIILHSSLLCYTDLLITILNTWKASVTLNQIIAKYNNPSIWLAGDLNLSNIDWLKNTITGNHYPSFLYNKFLDFMTYHGIVQINMQPTRCNNILDVFLTNQPLATSNVETAPSISNHEALIVKSYISVRSSPTIKGRFIFGTKLISLESTI